MDYYNTLKNGSGASYGENGYVKIERSDKTQDPGVCGVAILQVLKDDVLFTTCFHTHNCYAKKSLL